MTTSSTTLDRPALAIGTTASAVPAATAGPVGAGDPIVGNRVELQLLTTLKCNLQCSYCSLGVGEVLACQDEGEGVVMAAVDPARIAEVRLQLPALAHRRL